MAPAGGGAFDLSHLMPFAAPRGKTVEFSCVESTRHPNYTQRLQFCGETVTENQRAAFCALHCCAAIFRPRRSGFDVIGRSQTDSATPAKPLTKSRFRL